MDQNIKDDNFSKSWNNIDFPLENTNNEREKSNKCNQCEYAICILLGRPFQETSKNTHWRKVEPMQPVWIYQEKRQTNATNVSLHPFRQAIWGLIWKSIVEKTQSSKFSVSMHPLRHLKMHSQTNVTSVTIHPLRQVIWGHILKHTQENRQTNAPSVNMLALILVR